MEFEAQVKKRLNTLFKLALPYPLVIFGETLKNRLLWAI